MSRVKRFIKKQIESGKIKRKTSRRSVTRRANVINSAAPGSTKRLPGGPSRRRRVSTTKASGTLDNIIKRVASRRKSANRAARTGIKLAGTRYRKKK